MRPSALHLSRFALQRSLLASHQGVLSATRSICPIAGSILWTCGFICPAWRSITPTSKSFTPYNLVDSPHNWTSGPIHLGCVNFGASRCAEFLLCHSLILVTTDHKGGTMTLMGRGNVKSNADLDWIDGTTLINISFLTEGAPNYYPNSFSGPLDNLKHTPHAVKVQHFIIPPPKYYGLPLIKLRSRTTMTMTLHPFPLPGRCANSFSFLTFSFLSFPLPSEPPHLSILVWIQNPAVGDFFLDLRKVNAVVLSPIHGSIPTLVKHFLCPCVVPITMIIANAHMHLGKCSFSLYPLMVMEGAYFKQSLRKIHEQETKVFVTKWNESFPVLAVRLIQL